MSSSYSMEKISEHSMADIASKTAKMIASFIQTNKDPSIYQEYMQAH